jgi:hypothetical protein
VATSLANGARRQSISGVANTVFRIGWDRSEPRCPLSAGETRRACRHRYGFPRISWFGSAGLAGAAVNSRLPQFTLRNSAFYAQEGRDHRFCKPCAGRGAKTSRFGLRHRPSSRPALRGPQSTAALRRRSSSLQYRHLPQAGWPHWPARTTIWQHWTTILSLNYCRSDVGRVVLRRIASSRTGAVGARAQLTITKLGAVGSDRISFRTGL